jgi:hypothetical protein
MALERHARGESGQAALLMLGVLAALLAGTLVLCFRRCRAALCDRGESLSRFPENRNSGFRAPHLQRVRAYRAPPPYGSWSLHP